MVFSKVDNMLVTYKVRNRTIILVEYGNIIKMSWMRGIYIPLLLGKGLC